MPWNGRLRLDDDRKVLELKQEAPSDEAAIPNHAEVVLPPRELEENYDGVRFVSFMPEQ